MNFRNLLLAGLFVLTLIPVSIPAFAQDDFEDCILSPLETITVYAEPAADRRGNLRVGDADNLLIVGRSGDWLAWSNAGAQAGSAGTINFLWVFDDPEAEDVFELEGDCDEIPAFYPMPDYDGDVCGLTTTAEAQSYLEPDLEPEATEFPGVVVEILARAEGDWYGYDLATRDEVVGIERLHWISGEDVEALTGNCDAVPVINPDPIELTAADIDTTIELGVGDTLVITLSGNPTTGYIWKTVALEAGFNDPAIIQEQGDANFNPENDAVGSGGDVILTFQAVGEGETTLELVNAFELEVDEPNLETFTVTVVVTAD